MDALLAVAEMIAYPWDKPLAVTSMEDAVTITQRANVRESGIRGTTPVICIQRVKVASLS